MVSHLLVTKRLLLFSAGSSLVTTLQTLFSSLQEISLLSILLAGKVLLFLIIVKFLSNIAEDSQAKKFNLTFV